MKNKKMMPLLAIIACFLWGSAFPVLKNTYRLLHMEAGDIYEKVQLAGMRFLLAALMIGVVYLWQNKKLPKVSGGDVKWFLLLGLFQTTLQYFFFYNGLANTSGVKAAILSSCGTFFVVILAHFYYTNDKISIRKLIGLIFGFGGIVIINLNKVGAGSSLLDMSFQGEGFLVIAGIVSAVGTILAKGITKRRDPVLVTGGQMFLGSIVLLVVGTVMTGGKVLQFNTEALLLFVYSAFLSAVAFTIWFQLLRSFKATEVTMYKFLVPVFGSVLSVIFVQAETFNPYILIGLLCASMGIYVVNRSKSIK